MPRNQPYKEKRQQDSKATGEVAENTRFWTLVANHL